MKKIVSMLIAVLMLTCAAFAEEPTEDIAYEVPELTDVELDLNGDGAAETIRWQTVVKDEVEGMELSVNGETVWTNDLLHSAEVCAADLDGDGILELFVTGDEMSDDYLTFAMHYADGAAELLNFAHIERGGYHEDYVPWGYGHLTLLEGNCISLTGSQDVLGTYMATREFTLSGNTFETADDGLWYFENYADDAEMWEYRGLTNAQELTVIIADENGEREETLPVGTRIMLTASDLNGTAYFVTEDGREGYLTYEPDAETGWGVLVNGRNESEMFQMIPYAD